ncbi:MAG: transporter [Acidobacteria bacterium]|nr:transporter [Acidobacteriota bacterium]
MLHPRRLVTGRLVQESFDEAAAETPFAETHNPDLGFGAVVAQESRRRLLNRDGTFNTARRGLSYWASLNPYHALLTMPWPRFLGMVVSGYLFINLLFALVYTFCPGGLTDATNTGIGSRFWQGFFFSVHTFGTIGYGNVSPVGWIANLAVTIESLLSLLCVALATGILFARFSRPTARIIFSEKTVIAPYEQGTGLMFRLANGRRNELIEVAATVIYAQFESVEGKPVRKFYQLPLERSKVTFLSLSWTIVHPINEESPLWQLTETEVRARQGEILILLTGIDETFSQVVHARTSYRAEEMEWNAKFVNVFNKPDENGLVTIDLRRLHEFDRLS